MSKAENPIIPHYKILTEEIAAQLEKIEDIENVMDLTNLITFTRGAGNYILFVFEWQGEPYFNLYKAGIFHKQFSTKEKFLEYFQF